MSPEEFNTIEDYERACYIESLARRIADNVRDFYPDMEIGAMSMVLCEGLWTAARDIRAGRTARLEYIGDIEKRDGVPVLRWDDWLNQPLKEEDAA